MLNVFPKRATMIVTPGEPDATTPCGETPATPGLVEDHVTWSLSVAVTPLANRPVAVRALVPPDPSSRALRPEHVISCPRPVPAYRRQGLAS